MYKIMRKRWLKCVEGFWFLFWYDLRETRFLMRRKQIKIKSLVILCKACFLKTLFAVKKPIKNKNLNSSSSCLTWLDLTWLFAYLSYYFWYVLSFYYLIQFNHPLEIFIEEALVLFFRRFRNKNSDIFIL